MAVRAEPAGPLIPLLCCAGGRARSESRQTADQCGPLPFPTPGYRVEGVCGSRPPLPSRAPPPPSPPLVKNRRQDRLEKRGGAGRGTTPGPSRVQQLGCLLSGKAVGQGGKQGAAATCGREGAALFHPISGTPVHPSFLAHCVHSAMGRPDGPRPVRFLAIKGVPTIRTGGEGCGPGAPLATPQDLSSAAAPNDSGQLTTTTYSPSAASLIYLLPLIRFFPPSFPECQPSMPSRAGLS